MYETFLLLHSLLRWAVLALLAVRLLKSVAGVATKGGWTSGDHGLGIASLVATDLQLLLGIVLYAVLSPRVQAAMADPGAAMKDSELRFFLAEHPTMMVLAVVLVHIGHVLVKRAPVDGGKHKAAAITAFLALGLMLAGIRW